MRRPGVSSCPAGPAVQPPGGSSGQGPARNGRLLAGQGGGRRVCRRVRGVAGRRRRGGRRGRCRGCRSGCRTGRRCPADDGCLLIGLSCLRALRLQGGDEVRLRVAPDLLERRHEGVPLRIRRIGLGGERQCQFQLLGCFSHLIGCSGRIGVSERLLVQGEGRVHVYARLPGQRQPVVAAGAQEEGPTEQEDRRPGCGPRAAVSGRQPRAPAADRPDREHPRERGEPALSGASPRRRPTGSGSPTGSGRTRHRAAPPRRGPGPVRRGGAPRC